MDYLVPAEFRTIFRNMGPDFGKKSKSKEEYVLYELIGIDQAEAVIVRQFLDKILSSYSPQQLRTWWRSATTTTYFTQADELVEFLTIMQQVLGKPPYAIA